MEIVIQPSVFGKSVLLKMVGGLINGSEFFIQDSRYVNNVDRVIPVSSGPRVNVRKFQLCGSSTILCVRPVEGISMFYFI